MRNIVCDPVTSGFCLDFPLLLTRDPVTPPNRSSVVVLIVLATRYRVPLTFSVLGLGNGSWTRRLFRAGPSALALLQLFRCLLKFVFIHRLHISKVLGLAGM